MEKPSATILLILLAICLRESHGYCTKLNYDWYECNNIQDSEKLESTIHNFLESDASMRKLSINNCNISTISNTLFAHNYFSKITDLNITSSLVQFIELGSFESFERLQNLNFARNNIDEFNGKVLENLSYLESLNLKMNQLKMMRNMCFANNLKEINIDDINFTTKTINKNTFKNCVNVEKLSITNAGINSLKTNMSLHFPNLVHLNLSGNNFVNFDSFDYNTTLSINILDMSNNKIKTLDAEVFRIIFKNVNSINLNSNLIKYLVFGGQEPFGNTILKALYLNNNQIATINNVFVKYFSNLEILDIDNNPLENIASLSFNNLQYLEKLYIRNSLKKIKSLNSGVFNGLKSLKELDLSSASISSIEDSVFRDLNKLNKLNLQNNQLTELHNGTFIGLIELEYITLDNNNISSIDSGAFFGLNKIRDITPKTFFTKIQHLKTRQFEGLSYTYLSKLDLSYLAIKTLEKETFKGLSGLRHLHLQGNHIEELGANVFEGLEYLENLNMSHSLLSVIHQDAFSGLNNLRTLDLSNSIIDYLHPDTFEGIYGLHMLDLSNNRLRKTEPWIYRNLHSLQTLYLHNNVITTLQAHSFTGLVSMKTLTLSSIFVPVQDIEPGAFIGLCSLSTSLLSLFRNTKTLRTNIFVGLSNMREINLNGFKIEVIESNAFGGIHYIDVLNLENNNISVIMKEAFTSPVTIELLNLKRNNLNDLTSEGFLRSNITKLILDENNLNTLNFTEISQIPYLQILSIKNASIQSLIRSSGNVQDLKELYLQDNLISYLNYSMFTGMNNLLLLDLSRNPITTLQFTTFQQLINLKFLSLSEMDIEEISLSNLSGLKSLTTLSIQNSTIKYLRGYSFINTAIQHLNLVNNYIENISPTAFEGIQNLTHLDFSHNNLTKLDEIFAHDTLITLKHLNLSHNNLSSIKCNQFIKLNNLETLNLDNNQINNIDVCAFRNLTNLITLNLFSNNLWTIHPGTFKDQANLKNLNASYNGIHELYSYALFPLKQINNLDFSYNLLETNLSAFMSLKPHYLHVGLAGNVFKCNLLQQILEYFRNSYISVLQYGLTFDDTNIDGIKCTL